MRKLELLLLSGLGFFYSAEAWGQAIDKDKIWNDNRGAVVQIHAFGTGADGSRKPIDAGTGVFVSPEGYILTALHVVGKDDDWAKVGPDQTPDRHVEVTLLDHSGSPHVISQNAYVKVIAGVDLALLRVDGHCFQYSKLAMQRPSGFPTLVAIVWGADTVPHPTSTDLTETDVSKNGDKLTVDRIAAPGGYSGSPLFNSAGEVVGVLDNRFGDLAALAIPSTEAVQSVPVTSQGSGDAYPASCYALCPHPDNGIDHWNHEEAWTADSGWRDGGSDPTSFCATEKLKQESAHPGAVVTFEALPEDHRVQWNPFKHDQYRYSCKGVDRWDPVYVAARSPACGLQSQ
ncbi:serine protease [Mesorhizobium sp. WSM4884]|uniref:S1 family peptidase n=1 Tax=Mesorhizobium sp. WSM4884 TaxID=3038542 RepID=UPI0024178DDA|nr:serine protease [Mesorhizobium sp. WSM4884]MDG4881997.1 serine protease [Mesorhizobium sp. WSM4884]